MTGIAAIGLHRFTWWRSLSTRWPLAFLVLCTYPLFFLVVDEAIDGSIRYGLAVALAVSTAVALRGAFEQPRKSGNPTDVGAEVHGAFMFLSLWALLFLTLAIVTGYGAALPGHDPIIVPTVSKVVAFQGPTTEFFEPGDPGYTYPPAYPILFSVVHLLADPAAAVGLFRTLTLLVVSGLPFAWAILLRRGFSVDLPLPVLAVCAILAMFGLERTLSFTLVHGKNAQVFAGFLLPFGILALMRLRNGVAGASTGALLVGGLVAFHYSTIYMLATFFLGFFGFQLLLRRLDWGQVLTILVAGAGGLALFLLVVPEALSDPRAGSFRVPDVWLATKGFVLEWIRPRSDILFIFEDKPPAWLQAPWRGAILIAAAAGIAAVALFGRPPVHQRLALAHAGLTSFVMVVVGTLFANGLPPAGISPDFVRWYLMFPQSFLLMTAVAGLVAVCTAGGSWVRVLAAGVLLGVALFGQTTARHDLGNHSDSARNHTIPRATFTTMSETLTALAGGRPCAVVAPSFTIADGLHVVQVHRPLEYVEALTNCRMLNGSFVHRSMAARGLGGLPTPEMVAAAATAGIVLFVGTETEARTYAGIAPSLRFMATGASIGGAAIWLLANDSNPDPAPLSAVPRPPGVTTGIEPPPPSAPVAGHVDIVRAVGNTLVVEGWAPIPLFGEGRSLHIVTDSPATLVEFRTVWRPDVVAATGGRLHLGFSMRLDFAGQLPTKLCVIAKAEGDGAVLLDDAASGPNCRDGTG